MKIHSQGEGVSIREGKCVLMGPIRCSLFLNQCVLSSSFNPLVIFSLFQITEAPKVFQAVFGSHGGSEEAC